MAEHRPERPPSRAERKARKKSEEHEEAVSDLESAERKLQVELGVEEHKLVSLYAAEADAALLAIKLACIKIKISLGATDEDTEISQLKETVEEAENIVQSIKIYIASAQKDCTDGSKVPIVENIRAAKHQKIRILDLLAKVQLKESKVTIQDIQDDDYQQLKVELHNAEQRKQDLQNQLEESFVRLRSLSEEARTFHAEEIERRLEVIEARIGEHAHRAEAAKVKSYKAKAEMDRLSKEVNKYEMEESACPDDATDESTLLSDGDGLRLELVAVQTALETAVKEALKEADHAQAKLSELKSISRRFSLTVSTSSMQATRAARISSRQASSSSLPEKDKYVNEKFIEDIKCARELNSCVFDIISKRIIDALGTKSEPIIGAEILTEPQFISGINYLIAQAICADNSGYSQYDKERAKERMFPDSFLGSNNQFWRLNDLELNTLLPNKVNVVIIHAIVDHYIKLGMISVNTNIVHEVDEDQDTGLLNTGSLAKNAVAQVPHTNILNTNPLYSTPPPSPLPNWVTVAQNYSPESDGSQMGTPKRMPNRISPPISTVSSEGDVISALEPQNNTPVSTFSSQDSNATTPPVSRSDNLPENQKYKNADFGLSENEDTSENENENENENAERITGDYIPSFGPATRPKFK